MQMKSIRSATLAILASCLLMSSSCVDLVKPLAKGSEGYAEAVLPEYDAYVKADASLANNEAERVSRLENSTALAGSIKNAQGGGTTFEALLADIDRRTSTLLPQYDAYVTADTKISADTKRIRLQSSTGWKNLIATSKNPPK